MHRSVPVHHVSTVGVFAGDGAGPFGLCVSHRPTAIRPASGPGKVMEKQYIQAEAAGFLRVAESTPRRWISKEDMPCHRAGRLVRFTEADLTAALKPSPAVNADRPSGRPYCSEGKAD